LNHYADRIVQTIREPLLVLDENLQVENANASFYRAFQVTPEQTLGRPFCTLGNGQWDSAVLRNLLGELLPANGRIDDYQLEHDFPHIGLRTMLLNAQPLLDGAAKTRLILLTIDDITQRRQAERLLQGSETRYRRLFEAAHDGILILDAATSQITDVNPFMLELLGYPRAHFIGKELWEIGIFHDKEANLQAIRDLHRKGSVRFEDLPLQDRNGYLHPVEIVANIYQENSAPVIQCNIRDIADRVRFEREREALMANEQAARMEAEAANRSKDLFLATLSHEVRTPLNAILGWATILRGADCDSADLREGMEVIERSCKAQAQLIEDVLDISRIVSGQMHLEIRPCELTDVIHAAIDIVRPAADGKGVQFALSIDPAATRAACDVTRMRQVVWNLLANAVKFSASGNTVRISLSRESPSLTQIQVRDEGQGIAADFLPYVFDRFRQADGSTRRKFGGLGLGLSIVKHIVEMHGGTVRAASDGEGRGATFTISLPVRAVDAPAAPGEQRKSPAERAVPDLTALRLDGLRVLIVDNEADARRLLVKVLGEAGAIATAAGTVVEALEAVERTHPQVLLSDIAMPDQDGYDLIRLVRSAGHSAKDLPAVALTAFAHNDDRLRVLFAGFQVHVPKPIDPHELIVVIASLAGRTGSPATGSPDALALSRRDPPRPVPSNSR
jgi:PAS domain S-box-containing protein